MSTSLSEKDELQNSAYFLGKLPSLLSRRFISDFAENPGVYARDEGVKSGNKREKKVGLGGIDGGFSESEVNLKENTPRFSAGKFIIISFLQSGEGLLLND